MKIHAFFIAFSNLVFLATPEVFCQTGTPSQTTISQEYNVPRLGYSDDISRWTASMAILVGWLLDVRLDPADIRAGEGVWSNFIDRESRQVDITIEQDAVLARWALMTAQPRLYTVNDFRNYLEQTGPFWLAFDTHPEHPVVVSGLLGDGTPNGTLVIAQDPDDGSGTNPNPGQELRLPFNEFISASFLAQNFTTMEPTPCRLGWYPNDYLPPELEAKLPRGKGMFLSGNFVGAVGSPEEFTRRAVECQIKWIVFKGARQQEDGTCCSGTDVNDGERAVRQYTSAYRSAVPDGKIYVYGWGEARGRPRELVEALLQKAEWANADGVVLDLEGSWNERERQASISREANLLIDLALQEVHNRNMVLGVTSYGTAGFHPNIPYEIFARADFGLPQLYDLQNSIFDADGNLRTSHCRALHCVDYVRRGVEAWRLKGFSRVIPVLATKPNNDVPMKTAEQVAGLIRIATPVIDTAVCWWAWGSTAYILPAHWDIIRDFQLPNP